MRVVVTGAAGRLGQFVVRELFTHAHQVCGVDRVKPRECPCPTYIADLGKLEPLVAHFKNADAVVHLARLRFPYTEQGFDYATQSWRFDDRAGDAELFNQNLAMTNNVLAAAELAGVKKIVCGSSLAIYGFYYPTTKLLPDYLPVDEEHPLRPQDAYGLTKLAGEMLCTALSARSGMPIVSLRFSGIYTEEHRAMLAQRKGDPLIRGTGSLWSYLDARDAARAVRLALAVPTTGHQAFNIASTGNLVGMPIHKLAQRYLSAVTDRRTGLNGSGSGYSVAKAKNLLGCEAKISLVD